MDDTKTRRRRTHSEQLKAEVVAACAEPGASVAAVALARGLNTNLVHKWRRQAAPAADTTVSPGTAGSMSAAHDVGFVAVPLAAGSPLPAAEPEIRIEIRRGATSVAVHWPLSAAGECAAWLGAWLR